MFLCLSPPGPRTPPPTPLPAPAPPPLLRFPRAERGRVHNAAVARHRLLAEERARLHPVGLGVLAVHNVLWRTAVARFVFALEDQVVHGPRHDRAERPQPRRRHLRERRHQLAVAQRQCQELEVHVPLLTHLVAVVHGVQPEYKCPHAVYMVPVA